MVSEFIVHFMKWTTNLTISRNGQVGHPFHKMVNFVVHFMKWTISQLGRNIYIYPWRMRIKSRTGQPRTHIARESLVSLSGVLWMACWNLSEFRFPLGPVHIHWQSFHSFYDPVGEGHRGDSMMYLSPSKHCKCL